MADSSIGKVTHYYGKPSVAVVSLSKGTALKVGDKIKIKGHSEDFTQIVSSLQVDHKEVESVKAGDDFGMKVDQKVHEGAQLFSA